MKNDEKDSDLESFSDCLDDSMRSQLNENLNFSKIFDIENKNSNIIFSSTSRPIKRKNVYDSSTIDNQQQISKRRELALTLYREKRINLKYGRVRYELRQKVSLTRIRSTNGRFISGA